MIGRVRKKNKRKAQIHLLWRLDQAAGGDIKVGGCFPVSFGPLGIVYMMYPT